MSIKMSLFSNFNIFSQLDKQLINNIKLFNLTKNDLLFVTTNEQVYHFDLNKFYLTKFDLFCEHQMIIKFDCNVGDAFNIYNHFMVLTDKGCVYSFGSFYENLGHGNVMPDVFNTPKLIEKLSPYFIIDVCCGFEHTVVLSRNGEVLTFGRNVFGQCGNNTTINQLIPVQINLSKIIAISCGGYHSTALSEKMETFGWGSNYHNELGLDNKNTLLIPSKLSVPNIVQIISGDLYTLMLSKDGDVYFCGYIFDCISHRVPTMINSTIKFIQIATTINCNLCVALSTDYNFYILGNYNGNKQQIKLKSLHLSSFKNVEDIFSYHYQITFKSISKYKNIYKEDFVEYNSLGVGGFSSVFRAKHKFDNNIYAIKKISFNQHMIDGVIKEINILKTLQSQYVVEFYYSWIEKNYYIGTFEINKKQSISSDNLLYSPNLTQLLHIQMELCSMTLRDAINCIIKQCLKPNDTTLSLIGYYVASELLYELLECVQYLHSQNPAIIHRDLKPENILLTNFVNNRFVKLSDFGLSTYHEFADQSHTKCAGTKNYRAFEVNNSSIYSTKADIYSLGVIIQELFHIDISKTNKTVTSVLESKNNFMLSLIQNLLSFLPINRPDCIQILNEQYLWRLSYEQLLNNPDIKNIFSNTDNLELTTSTMVLPSPNSTLSKNLNKNNFIEYFVKNKFGLNCHKYSKQKADKCNLIFLNCDKFMIIQNETLGNIIGYLFESLEMKADNNLEKNFDNFCNTIKKMYSSSEKTEVLSNIIYGDIDKIIIQLESLHEFNTDGSDKILKYIVKNISKFNYNSNAKVHITEFYLYAVRISGESIEILPYFISFINIKEERGWIFKKNINEMSLTYKHAIFEFNKNRIKEIIQKLKINV